jgi:hypothetical protein
LGLLGLEQLEGALDILEVAVGIGIIRPQGHVAGKFEDVVTTHCFIFQI